MQTMEDYERFLVEVRKETGVEALAADESGLASVRVDDRYNLNLHFIEATGKILCFVEVATLPQDASAAVYRDLLAAGLFGAETAGGYFAVEKESGTVARRRHGPVHPPLARLRAWAGEYQGGGERDQGTVADGIVQNAKQENIADNYIAPDTTLHRAFIVDLGRTTVVINGKTHAIGATDAEEAKTDFKNALAGKPNAQIAISSLMQQGASMPIMELQTHNPTPPTDTRPDPAQSFKAAGAEAFVNCDPIANPGLYAIPQIIDNPESRNELSVSPDDNPRVIAVRLGQKVAP